MTSSAHHTIDDNESAFPVARIEAQDVAWAHPLREYLEQHGCQVVINRDFPTRPVYVICVGDTDFVKAFFEGKKWPHAKKLAIIYEGQERDLAGIRTFGVKQYYIDPKPLGEKQTRDIFAFFFTAKAISVNDRKEPAAVKKMSVIPQEPPREPSRKTVKTQEADRSRIARDLQQIYAKNRMIKKTGETPVWRLWIAWAGMAIVVCLVPMVFYVLSLVTSVGLLTLGVKTLTSGNTRWTPTLISYSNTYTQVARGMLALSSPALLLLRQDGLVGDQDRLLSILSQISSAESGVLTIFATSKTVAAGILFPDNTTQKTGVADVIALSTEVSCVSQHLGLVAAQLDSLLQSQRFPFNSSFVSDLTIRGLGKLTNIRNLVSYTDRLLTLYPRMAGFRRKQTYLVLLQNSMELRPTGGFIGSLLVLSFVDGKVESLDVMDVYTADGQLKGHVDPPLPIREILGVEHWYLRDSNWNPDFSSSGETAAWFYEKEMNQSVDGVIAISLPMVTRLLQVTGPIELLDFNERISAGNFFAKSLLYTETDFFPGSTQKKDFLGALTSALLARVTTDRTLSAGALLDVIRQSLRSRDIQFYFPDEELQSLVTQWGWNGGVDVHTCQAFSSETSCIGDGVAVVDANLGVNKTNFFVTKAAVSQVVIQENGDVDHALTVNIRNAAPTQNDGGGAYQSYLRFIVPEDADVLSVTLDGEDIPARNPESPIPPPAPYVVNEEAFPFRIIHVPFSVGTHQTRQLTIRWMRREKVIFSAEGAYQLGLRKQSGVEVFPWRMVIQYPERWRVVSESSVAKPGVLEYNTDLTEDAIYRILFRKTL